MINKKTIQSQIDFNKTSINVANDIIKYFEGLIEFSRKNFYKGIYTENFEKEINLMKSVIYIAEINNRVLEDMLISEGEL